ncbi:IS1 family transposase [Escherichia coli]
MTSVTVYCPRCQSAQVYHHGQNRTDCKIAYESITDSLPVSA